MGRMTHDAAVCVLENELDRIRACIDYESGNENYYPDFLHRLCWQEEAYRMSIDKLRKVWKLK